MRLQTSKKTENNEAPPFDAWFEGSVVVDGQGKPLTVFHGTMEEVTEWNSTRSAHFTDSPHLADKYARSYQLKDIPGANILPVFLQIRNPIDLRVPLNATRIEQETGIRLDDELLGDPEELQKCFFKLHLHGYDGIICPHQISMGVPDRNTEYIPFWPAQIRSIYTPDQPCGI